MIREYTHDTRCDDERIDYVASTWKNMLRCVSACERLLKTMRYVYSAQREKKNKLIINVRKNEGVYSTALIDTNLCDY